MARRRLTLYWSPAQNDIVYLVYKLPTVVISRRTDQYSKAHEILTGVAASAAKRPRTAPMVPTTAASVPPPGGPQRGDSSGALDAPKLAHASTAPEGAVLDTSPLGAHPWSRFALTPFDNRPQLLHKLGWVGLDRGVQASSSTVLDGIKSSQ